MNEKILKKASINAVMDQEENASIALPKPRPPQIKRKLVH